MKKVFSGVQPTGEIHLGNYITMKNFLKHQEDKECLYCVVDMHSITVPQDPEELRKNSLGLAALYMAIGLDPSKVKIFLQSTVPAHAELSWILQCNSYMGELNRMTQFKDKSQKQTSISTALFTYPVLMAADILLYDTDLVPVGEDQKQHLELTRDIAIRFNNKYGKTFVVPEPMIQEVGARISSLDDPSTKMSKSNPNQHSKISLLDSPAKIKKTIMKATTDSEALVKYDKINKPGVSNLMTIYSILGDISIEEIENKYVGVGYGQFKKDLVEVVINHLSPIQERYHSIVASGEVERILKENAKTVSELSQTVLNRVKEKVGFVTF